MKGFIEVTDERNEKTLVPINRIFLIRERGDGSAVINLEMVSDNFRTPSRILTDITTIEKYSAVIEEIKRATR